MARYAKKIACVCGSVLLRFDMQSAHEGMTTCVLCEQCGERGPKAQTKHTTRSATRAIARRAVIAWNEHVSVHKYPPLRACVCNKSNPSVHFGVEYQSPAICLVACAGCGMRGEPIRAHKYNPITLARLAIVSWNAGHRGSTADNHRPLPGLYQQR